MAEYRTFECPACGSPLKTTGEQAEVECEYCGKSVIVPENLRVRPEPPPAPAPSMPPIVIVERERSERRERREPVRRSGGGGCGCSGFLVLLLVLVAGGYSYLRQNSTVAAELQSALHLPAGLPIQAALATPVPFNRPITAALPRQAKYAGLEFSLLDGAITNQQTSGGLDIKRLLAREQAQAYLDVKIKNPTASGIQSDLNMISLRLADGERYAEQSGWAESVSAESTQQARLTFSVPVSATWQGSQLVIGTPGKVPATIALDGPASPARYPMTLGDKGKATAGQVDYQIQSATLDLDANGKRAATGHRFLVLAMHMFNHNPAAGGVAITTANFRLAVGDDMLAPVTAPIEAVAPNSVLDGTVVFDIAGSANRADLQVGEVGRGDTAKITINLPAP